MYPITYLTSQLSQVGVAVHTTLVKIALFATDPGSPGGFGAPVASSPPVAQTPSGAASLIENSAKAACGTSCGTSDLNHIFVNISNTLIFLIGSISIIMIIIGGLRYVLANGDSKAAEAGRNTILYAVIGLILAISAYGIVKFVTATFH